MDELARQYIIDLINRIDIQGIIEQTSYDFIVESLSHEFELSKRAAQGLAMSTLKHLYIQKAV